MSFRLALSLSIALLACGPENAPEVGEVVVNEIDADDDWIELYNATDRVLDVSGLTLTTADENGNPKIDNGIRFPSDTTIAGGDTLIILARKELLVSPGEQEPQTECAPGESPCFYAPFGISDTLGEEILLIDHGTTISSATYPPDAAGNDETWCRFPDATGELQECEPTPDEANEAKN